MGRLAGGRSARGFLGLALVAVLGVTACSSSPRPSPRDLRWQRDIDYLVTELPVDRAAGLGDVTSHAWHAAAARLEAAVPGMTDGQIAAGLAKLVAMPHDNETLVRLPPGKFLPLDAQWIDGGLYLLAVPQANRGLLGGRLLAVDGHPVGQALARLAATIGAEDPQLRSDVETGELDDLGLLHSLGLTASAKAAVLTVRTVAGRQEQVRIAGTGSGFIMWPFFLADQEPGLAHVPLPLYRQDATKPYWLRVLPTEHAVYLKYNQCVSDDGFQRPATQALALLAAHHDYRLIVDLRDNLGGATAPFQVLTAGIQADPRLAAPGRIIGLVNQFTDSSATLDAQNLKDAGAVLIGQPPADPHETWGDWRTFRLPLSGLVIQYTTTQLNRSGKLWGIPDVVVAPTLAQVLAGDDPVLAAALRHPA